MINKKLSELRQLKQQILEIECNLRILKQQNTKLSFEYAKIKTRQLKDLKIQFQQAEIELQDLLEKGSD